MGDFDGAGGVRGPGGVVVLAECDDGEVADFEHGEGSAEHAEGFEGEDIGAGLGHGFGVVDGEHDLVVALGGDGAAHPDFVALVAGGDVGDYAADVEAFAGAEVASELGGSCWLQDESELLGEHEGQGLGLV